MKLKVKIPILLACDITFDDDLQIKDIETILNGIKDSLDEAYAVSRPTSPQSKVMKEIKFNNITLELDNGRSTT